MPLNEDGESQEVGGWGLEESRLGLEAGSWEVGGKGWGHRLEVRW